MLPAKWPRWIIAPIGFGVAVASIVLGLILVVSVQAFVPDAEPTATPPLLGYAAPLSGECTACHTDEERLEETAATREEAESAYIEASLVGSTHGRLGCVTCHQGTPDTEDIDQAHTGLVADVSLSFQDDCLLCHRELLDEYEESGLLAPHSQVVAGTAADLTCSDCHGSVGHGYDPVTGEPIIRMAACIECHEERDLDVACEVCHTEMAAWSPETDCALCHADYVQGRENPDLLAYAHAQEGMVCGDCHNDLEALGEAHVGALPGAQVPALRVDMQFCFDCHVDNEHTSYAQIIELTADYIIDEQNINPHDPHPDTEEVGEIQCYTCHKNHKESPLIKGCYGCHHTGTFESCTECHATAGGGD